MIGRRLGVIEKSLATAQMQAPRLAYCSMGNDVLFAEARRKKAGRGRNSLSFCGISAPGAKTLWNDRAQDAALMQPVRRVCNGIG